MASVELACSASRAPESGAGASRGGSNGQGGSTVSPGGGLNLGGTSNPGGAVSLTISPEDPVLDVTVADGTVTKVTGGADAKGTVTFQAISGGSTVSARWSIDRGELGALAVAGGSFMPSGSYSGVGIVSAAYGSATGQTKLTINLHVTQNGGTWDPSTIKAGAGGIGGVGGAAPGAPVDEATRMRLLAPRKPAGAAELSLLYPYDGTVWPRGLFAPLLQWQTSHASSAVYVHLTQQYYEFQGFYAADSALNEHIDQKAWLAATNGNAGDPLHVAVSIADGAQAYGPVSENWTVAPGQLKGTVYYQSYASQIAGEAHAGILAIKPGEGDPVLALPRAVGQCLVCHSVSDDGSTLFAHNETGSSQSPYIGSSYDLTNAGAPVSLYADASSAAGFMWAGLSKDGSYALSSSTPFDHFNTATSSGIFRRDNGKAEVANGFDGQVIQASTPAFSRDGKHVAFNYWTGTLPPGGGRGHTLDVMDFACGAPVTPISGAPSCGSFTFSNLRRLFTSPDAKSDATDTLVTGVPAWPAWLPDSSGIVFQNLMRGSRPLNTWNGAKSQLWFVGLSSDGSAPQAVALAALNGDDSTGKSILPAATGISGHDDDDQMNFGPTVNPVVSGGYAWVVFTSRRMYGNVAAGDPYESGGDHPVTKKLWVAAVDLNWKPGKDPSHPAFYLPGQELNAGNMQGYWVVDPCHGNGTTCKTGDECCNGYCRPDDGGNLVCGDTPKGCAQEFDKCSNDASCCAGSCINQYCVSAPPK